MIDTAEARRVLEAMTAGEWEESHATGDCYLRRHPESRLRLNRTGSWAVGPDCRSECRAIADARGIAYLRNHAGEWLDEIDRLRTELGRR